MRAEESPSKRESMAGDQAIHVSAHSASSGPKPASGAFARAFLRGMRSGHAQLKRQELFQRKLCTCFGDPSACFGEGGGLGVHGSEQSPEKARPPRGGKRAKKAKARSGKLGGSSSVPAKLPPLAGGATAGATGAPAAPAPTALVDLQRLAAATHKAETLPPSAAERAADKTVHEDDELRILQLADMVLASAWRGVAWQARMCPQALEERASARLVVALAHEARRVAEWRAAEQRAAQDAAVREEACALTFSRRELDYLEHTRAQLGKSAGEHERDASALLAERANGLRDYLAAERARECARTAADEGAVGRDELRAQRAVWEADDREVFRATDAAARDAALDGIARAARARATRRAHCTAARELLGRGAALVSRALTRWHRGRAVAMLAAQVGHSGIALRDEIRRSSTSWRAEASRVARAERAEAESVAAWQRLQCAVIDAAEATTRRTLAEHRPQRRGEGLISVANEQHEMRSWFLEAHSFRMAHERAQFDQQRVAAATEAAAVGRAWATALDEWRKSSRGTLLHHHRAAAKAFRQLARDTSAHLAEIAEQHTASVKGAWEQLGAEHAAAAAAEELRLAKLAQLRELANVEWAEHAERGFGGHAGVLSALAEADADTAARDSKALEADEAARAAWRERAAEAAAAHDANSAERRADHETSEATICQAMRGALCERAVVLLGHEVELVTAACDDGGNTQTTERAPPPELGTLSGQEAKRIDTSDARHLHELCDAAASAERAAAEACAQDASARESRLAAVSAAAEAADVRAKAMLADAARGAEAAETAFVGARRERVCIALDEAFGDVRELAERLGASEEVHVPNEESMDQRSLNLHRTTYQLALERERARLAAATRERFARARDERRAARAADRAQARARQWGAAVDAAREENDAQARDARSRDDAAAAAARAAASVRANNFALFVSALNDGTACEWGALSAMEGSCAALRREVRSTIGAAQRAAAEAARAEASRAENEARWQTHRRGIALEMVQSALREGFVELRTACAPRNTDDAWGAAERATRDAQDSASHSADDDVGAQGHGEMHTALHALIERALTERKDAGESLERALEHARVTSAGEAEALERELTAAAAAHDDGNGDDASTLSSTEQRKRAKERDEREAELLVVRRRREHDVRAGAVKAFTEAAQRVAELEVEHDAAATAASARLTALHEAAVRATTEAWQAFREASARHWHAQRTALTERGTALRKQLDESVHSERARSEQDLASERERGATAAQKASRAAARDDALVNSLVTEWVKAQQRALKVALAHPPVPPPKPAGDRAGKFQMHDSIEALFEGGDEWFPGVIAGVNADGTYAVQYDDGDAESSVGVELIRSQHGANAPPSPPPPTEMDAASRVPLEHRRDEAWKLLQPLPKRLPYSAQGDIEQARLKSAPIRAAAVVSALVGELCAAAVARAEVDEAGAEVAAACEVTLPELEEQLKEAEQSEARRADERCAAALVSLDGLLDAWNSAHLELGGMCATQLKEHQRALKERADGELQSSAELDDQNTQDSATSAAPRSRAPSLRKKM